MWKRANNNFILFYGSAYHKFILTKKNQWDRFSCHSYKDVLFWKLIASVNRTFYICALRIWTDSCLPENRHHSWNTFPWCPGVVDVFDAELPGGVPKARRDILMFEWNCQWKVLWRVPVDRVVESYRCVLKTQHFLFKNVWQLYSFHIESWWKLGFPLCSQPSKLLLTLIVLCLVQFEIFSNANLWMLYQKSTKLTVRLKLLFAATYERDTVRTVHVASKVNIHVLSNVVLAGPHFLSDLSKRPEPNRDI